MTLVSLLRTASVSVLVLHFVAQASPEPLDLGSSVNLLCEFKVTEVYRVDTFVTERKAYDSLATVLLKQDANSIKTTEGKEITTIEVKLVGTQGLSIALRAPAVPMEIVNGDVDASLIAVDPEKDYEGHANYSRDSWLVLVENVASDHGTSLKSSLFNSVELNRATGVARFGRTINTIGMNTRTEADGLCKRVHKSERLF